jgi:hypothetical protein
VSRRPGRAEHDLVDPDAPDARQRRLVYIVTEAEIIIFAARYHH